MFKGKIKLKSNFIEEYAIFQEEVKKKGKNFLRASAKPLDRDDNLSPRR